MPLLLLLALLFYAYFWSSDWIRPCASFPCICYSDTSRKRWCLLWELGILCGNSEARAQQSVSSQRASACLAYTELRVNAQHLWRHECTDESKVRMNTAVQRMYKSPTYNLEFSSKHSKKKKTETDTTIQNGISRQNQYKTYSSDVLHSFSSH